MNSLPTANTTLVDTSNMKTKQSKSKMRDSSWGDISLDSVLDGSMSSSMNSSMSSHCFMEEDPSTHTASTKTSTTVAELDKSDWAEMDLDGLRNGGIPGKRSSTGNIPTPHATATNNYKPRSSCAARYATLSIKDITFATGGLPQARQSLGAPRRLSNDRDSDEDEGDDEEERRSKSNWFKNLYRTKSNSSSSKTKSNGSSSKSKNSSRHNNNTTTSSSTTKKDEKSSKKKEKKQRRRQSQDGATTTTSSSKSIRRFSTR